MYGVSDHDLMFSCEAIDIDYDSDHDAMGAPGTALMTSTASNTPASAYVAAAQRFKIDEQAYIERRVAEAQRLIRLESEENALGGVTSPAERRRYVPPPSRPIMMQPPPPVIPPASRSSIGKIIM